MYINELELLTLMLRHFESFSGFNITSRVVCKHFKRRRKTYQPIIIIFIFVQQTYNTMSSQKMPEFKIGDHVQVFVMMDNNKSQIQQGQIDSNVEWFSYYGNVYWVRFQNHSRKMCHAHNIRQYCQFKPNINPLKEFSTRKKLRTSKLQTLSTNRELIPDISDF